MLKSQEKALAISKNRQDAAELTATVNGQANGATDEQRNRLKELDTEHSTLQTEYRAAVEAEADAESRARAGWDPGETAEIRALRGRVALSAFVGAALEGRSVDGAEREYNAALNIAPGRFPLELLAPAPEVRANTDVNAATVQAGWLDRLFAETAAMRLGVSFQAVAPGVSAHPVTTGGAAAAQRGKGQKVVDAAWTVGVTNIEPTRNAVRCTFNDVDAARLPGLEEALRRDLGAALTEGIDRAVFLGDEGAEPADGDIVGLDAAAGVVEKTLTQANKVKGPETLAAFAELLDGKHAGVMSDLRVVTGVALNVLWVSTNISGESAQPKTLASYLMDADMSWTARGDLDMGTTDANDFGAYVGRGRGIEGAGVAAVWNSAAMIRDPYGENAAKGEVALTLATLWGFKLPRPSNFARLKFAA